MTRHNRPFELLDAGDWRLITLGTGLVVASLLAAGWFLTSGDLPGGLATLLLTVSGALFVAIGTSESSRPSA
ncbi:hypothetical protein Huta_1681 [Halorhabdus utahensis DSM 12940]|uniref:Uncharacterized protein n=1 Tax=Halorhabdus utahensis (strain DSM 12940 / JCM 11049 / AX-2) TaxID=519442 RepID=C7NQV0_HALUD|nr:MULTISPECIES: hypothetical protein [Halorhabdus]ACV11854.1 hypothetical protein Huta_1681 [Halorhabdus utahensis DSM 12940]WEL18947.1 putative membrane protein [Halorhabdus sp. SVX81]